MKVDFKKKIHDGLKNNDIEISDDVFSYGYDLLHDYFLFFCILIPISIILHQFFFTLLFIIFFIPLRRYLGGFHFKSKLACLISSVALSLCFPYVSLSLEYLPFTIRLISFIVIVMITYGIKATDHPNKRLAYLEKSHFTKIALIIEFIYFIPILCFYNSHTILVLNLLYMTSICSTINLLIVKVIKIVKLKF